MVATEVDARPRSLAARIHEHYAELPGSERKLADLILDFPGEVAAYSATELADLASVSKAAVTRLVQRLGFASFEEARRLARGTRPRGAPLTLHPLAGDGSRADGTRETVLAEDVEALARTIRAIPSDQLDAIVERLVRAERVWLFGCGDADFVAAYARWQLAQVRGAVHLLPQAGDVLAAALAELTPGDLLVVITLRRRAAGLARVMDVAREAGTPILRLSGPAARETPPATWTLCCEVASSTPFETYVGPIGLVHLLGVLAMKRAGRTGRRRHERIERIRERLRSFD